MIIICRRKIFAPNQLKLNPFDLFKLLEFKKQEFPVSLVRQLNECHFIVSGLSFFTGSSFATPKKPKLQATKIITKFLHEKFNLFRQNSITIFRSMRKFSNI
jgi:hypothetical protein